MFDLNDVNLEQWIILCKLFFARMTHEVVLFECVKELVVIGLGHDVVEILALLHS